MECSPDGLIALPFPPFDVIERGNLAAFAVAGLRYGELAVRS